MTRTPSHWLSSHWVVYDPENDRCLRVSEIDHRILWEKKPLTNYLLLSLDNIEYIEKFQCMLVTVEVDVLAKRIVNKLLINFLTKKAMWRKVIVVPVVGSQYHGHTSCEELPEHLDFVRGFKFT